MLNDAGFKLNEGFDIVYYGNLPSASGLSSSAAMEVLTILLPIDYIILASAELIWRSIHRRQKMILLE